MRKVEMESRWTTTLLFADSKVGKTTLAAMAPKPLILNRDNGTSSLLYEPRFKDVRIEDVKSCEHLDRCRDNLSGVGEKNWTKRKTVIVDDLAAIQLLIQDELMERVVERDPRRELDDPSRKEYGILGNRLRRYVTGWKRLPMHTIFVCGRRFDEESQQWRPSLIGAMKDQIAHHCDIVAYLRINSKTGHRVIHFRSTGQIYAETRFRWLPSKIIDPNMSEIFRMVQEKPKDGRVPLELPKKKKKKKKKSQ